MRKFAVLFIGLLAYQLNNAQVTFIENKGQWSDFILYRQQLHQGELLFAKDRFVYSLREDKANPLMEHREKHEEQNLDYQGHIYQARFVNANQDVKVSPSKASSAVFNYYLGNQPSKWATGVKAYQKLTYHNLYEGIDMQVYENEQLKYDFMVAAHTSPAQIQLKYEGADKVEIDERGNLKIYTSVTTVTELAPTAYQLINGEKRAVPCSFFLLDNTVSFLFPQKYDENYPLIIDPAIVFSTYTGSTQDNWGFTATGENGQAVGGGIVFNAGLIVTGNTGYPVLGAYQTGFQGGDRDVTITSYTATGSNLIFSTYIGGGGSEQPHSIAIAPNHDIYVLGRTNSNTFPVITGGYDQVANGGFDLFVLRFNSSGTLLGSTYLGGLGDDGVNISSDDFTFSSVKYNYADDARGIISVNVKGEVCLAACTHSGNFPITNNAFQGMLKGTQDGVIVKLSADLDSLLSATYLGGTNDEAIYDIDEDAGGNIYVVGGTNSTNFPTTAGSLSPTAKGGIDGFIAKMNPSLTNVLAATYVGTSSYDQTFLMDIDESANLYIFGQTTGNIPIINANYGQSNTRQFIASLDNNLSQYLYCTTIGTNAAQPNLSPAAFKIDSCHNVYFSGWGGTTISNQSSGTTGMPVSANAFDATTDGNDFYFGVLETNANSLLYGTFFGGDNLSEHVDGGTSFIDKKGLLYQGVCAGCGNSGTFPTTPGVWSSINGSNNCNLGVVVFNLNSNCNPTNLGSVRPRELAAVNVFPNPTSGNVTIQHLPQGAQVEVFDMVGKKYATYNALSPSLTLDLPYSLQGWVILNFSTSTERQSVKIFVSR